MSTPAEDRCDGCRALEKRVEELERILKGIGAVFTGGTTDSCATDREMDQTWGDPTVALIPRDWTIGGVTKGQKFSTCPPEFLDVYADTMNYFAQKNDAANAVTTQGKPKSFFDRKNEKFARGWARRLRSGWKPSESAANGFSNGHNPLASGTNPFATSANPLSPTPRAEPTDSGTDDDSFAFGANVKPANANLPNDDDDPPLNVET